MGCRATHIYIYVYREREKVIIIINAGGTKDFILISNVSLKSH
jgi:hypothetical protein